MIPPQAQLPTFACKGTDRDDADLKSTDLVTVDTKGTDGMDSKGTDDPTPP